MRFAILTLVLLLLIPQTFAETPRQFANRFYRAHQRWNVRGIPDASESRKLSGYFGVELLRLFEAVEDQRHRERRRFKTKYRDDPHPPLVKPLWCREGDWFSSSYEGVTTSAIGHPKIQRGRVIVPAYLTWGVGGTPDMWTDLLVLDRAGDSWVVADIRFERGESLVSSLTAELAEAEAYLRSPVK